MATEDDRNPPSFPRKRESRLVSVSGWCGLLKAIRIPAFAGNGTRGYLAGVAEKPVTKSHRNAGFAVGLGTHSSTFASSISITGMSSLMG